MTDILHIWTKDRLDDLAKIVPIQKLFGYQKSLTDFLDRTTGLVIVRPELEKNASISQPYDGYVNYYTSANWKFFPPKFRERHYRYKLEDQLSIPEMYGELVTAAYDGKLAVNSLRRNARMEIPNEWMPYIKRSKFPFATQLKVIK